MNTPTPLALVAILAFLAIVNPAIAQDSAAAPDINKLEAAYQAAKAAASQAEVELGDVYSNSETSVEVRKEAAAKFDAAKAAEEEAEAKLEKAEAKLEKAKKAAIHTVNDELWDLVSKFSISEVNSMRPEGPALQKLEAIFRGQLANPNLTPITKTGTFQAINRLKQALVGDGVSAFQQKFHVKFPNTFGKNSRMEMLIAEETASATFETPGNGLLYIHLDEEGVEFGGLTYREESDLSRKDPIQ